MTAAAAELVLDEHRKREKKRREKEEREKKRKRRKKDVVSVVEVEQPPAYTNGCGEAGPFLPVGIQHTRPAPPIPKDLAPIAPPPAYYQF